MAKGDGAGRPTDMTEETLAIIKQGIIDGRPLRDMAQPCGVSESTLYEWTYKNYGNFADKLENWKLQAKLKKAESRADEILSLPLHDKDGKVDTAVLNTVQKESQFIRETIAKNVYSKRNEHTGADGKDLPTPILTTTYVHNDNIDQEDNGDEQKNQSSSGGDISEQDNINTPLLDTLSTERQGANTDEHSS